jgi:hypothetical protein
MGQDEFKEQENLVAEQREKGTLNEEKFPKICVICKEKNLIEEIHFLSCTTCNDIYCVHFASGVDPINCAKCLNDVQMTEETRTEKREHYNEDLDRVISRTSRYRNVQFTGLDWLFFNRKIHTLTDTELSLAIEYHQAIYQSMIYEREKRKIEHFHRNAGKTYTVRVSTGDTKTFTKETTTVRKTRTVKTGSPETQQIQLKSMLEAMLKSGLSPTDIAKLVAKK